MKSYKRKMYIENNTTDRESAQAIRKSLNSSERLKARREVKKELSDPETSQWKEKAIIEYYENSYSATMRLINTLRKLDINMFESEGYGWFYDEADLVEDSIKLPKGYHWWRGKVEKE